MSEKNELGLMDIFINPMKVTVKQFFKSTFGKPATVMYPLEKRDPPPTYRGMNAVIWDLCIGCGICVNKCPFDSLIITNLPEELEGEMTHRYDQNGFRLFRLPAPREKQVVGILGPNGMGKSTAINLLSGSIQPNLGDWTINSAEWKDIIESFPRGELRDYLQLVADDGLTNIQGKYSNFEILENVAVPFTIEIQNNIADQKLHIDYRNIVANQRNVYIDFYLPDDATIVSW